MPPFILIILLLVAGSFMVQTFVQFPLELIRNFNLPGSAIVVLLAVVLVWCFGE